MAISATSMVGAALSAIQKQTHMATTVQPLRKSPKRQIEFKHTDAAITTPVKKFIDKYCIQTHRKYES